MIANFQTLKAATWYRNWLWGRGYLASISPYRGGWRVFAGFQLVIQ